jgi:hypothetical protein
MNFKIQELPALISKEQIYRLVYKDFFNKTGFYTYTLSIFYASLLNF